MLADVTTAWDAAANADRAALRAQRTPPWLLAEIRDMVVARNHRRVARGREPLDVEAEIERQVRDLGG